MPSIRLSLVIPCGPDDERLLQELLISIDYQHFQKEELEVLIMREDAGNSEEAKARGILKASGRIIGMLCADNQLLGTTFLQDLCEAAEDPQVVGAYPARYAWMSGDPPLNRYFALLGANDPVCWWLGKADRSSYLEPLSQHADLLQFRDSIPSLGDNGCFFKRQALQLVVREPSQFGSCMDMCEDLRRLGYATYAIINHVIWHKTGLSFWKYLRKRYHYVQTLYWQAYGIRRWRMVSTWSDWIKILLFALSSLLLVPHLWVSLRGYRRIKDPAWFFHPVICWTLTLCYTWALVMHLCSLRWLSRHGSERQNWRPVAPV